MGDELNPLADITIASRRGFLAGIATGAVGTGAAFIGKELFDNSRLNEKYEIAGCMALARNAISLHGLDIANPDIAQLADVRFRARIESLKERMLELNKTNNHFQILGNIIPSLKALSKVCETDNRVLAATAFYSEGDYDSATFQDDGNKFLSLVNEHKEKVLSLVKANIDKTIEALGQLHLPVIRIGPPQPPEKGVGR